MAIILYAMIHLLCFIKANNLASVNLLVAHISKPHGLLWVAAAILFVAAILLLFLKKDYWWILSAGALIVSQYMICSHWHSAKYGTIANLVILITTVVGYGTWRFSNIYRKEVMNSLTGDVGRTDQLLSEADIQDLPEPVKKYLRYTGATGKPKVNNFKIAFIGQIRKNERSAWMPFVSEQYNFIHTATRLFFMDATMKHLPVTGFHQFKNGIAFMDIRLLSLFRVQYLSGKEMNVAETVTFFNDMCCMAPATLIDKRITWIEATHDSVKAEFTNNNITISARLYFNDSGALVNFISDDRYAAGENNTVRRLRWATPLKEYKDYNGRRLASQADVIYSYPEGDMCYGNFRLTNIEYNCKQP